MTTNIINHVKMILCAIIFELEINVCDETARKSILVTAVCWTANQNDFIKCEKSRMAWR